jgi:NAD(P)-dependent dehydrogenase (short-subunit alcohol dehydrogenase family)
MVSSEPTKASALDPKAAGARRLEGKVCVVTGAGQGIGRATARRLGAEGGRIVVGERVETTARETVRQLTDAGVDAVANIADVSVLAEAERLMADTVTRFGRIDVLVNVVGGTIWWRPFAEYDETQIQLELERSLYTALWCCRAALPHMIRQQSGSIVNLGSHVTHGGLYRVPYAVSKGGVEALTRTLAAENGRYGIRVNAVAPGSTSSDDQVTSRLTLKPGVLASPENSDAYFQETRGVKRQALGRRGKAEEQAAAIAFFASDDASYVTGQILDCGGGVF